MSQITTMKVYPKKEKKAYQPRFNSDGTYNHIESSKKNEANFMSAENWAKSKYSTMDKNDFEEERQKDMWATKSF
jgi:hypothetical protein